MFAAYFLISAFCLVGAFAERKDAMRCFSFAIVGACFFLAFISGL